MGKYRFTFIIVCLLLTIGLPRTIAKKAVKVFYLKGVPFNKAAAYKAGSLIERGEDAYYFTSSDIGVFDGVGSWINQAVDCGEYTRSLAHFVSKIIKERREEHNDVDIDLKEVLIESCKGSSKLRGSR